MPEDQYNSSALPFIVNGTLADDDRADLLELLAWSPGLRAILARELELAAAIRACFQVTGPGPLNAQIGRLTALLGRIDSIEQGEDIPGEQPMRIPPTYQADT